MAQPLSKDIGKPIPPEQGKQWIQNYQDKNPESVKAVFFGADILQAILAQKECVGIRIYHAIRDDGVATFVLVGAKANGNNIWLSTSPDSTPSGILGEYGTHCPPFCNDNE